MKKLLVCLLMGSALSSAFAAPASPAAPAPSHVSVAPATAPSTAHVTKAKDLQGAAAPTSAKDVIGVWVSAERTTVVAPGTMTLTSSGVVTLAPEGFDPLKGTYKVDGQFLDITTDRGRATLIHKITKDTMTVQYENGSVQHFTKQPAAANSAKSKAKK